MRLAAATPASAAKAPMFGGRKGSGSRFGQLTLPGAECALLPVGRPPSARLPSAVDPGQSPGGGSTDNLREGRGGGTDGSHGAGGCRAAGCNTCRSLRQPVTPRGRARLRLPWGGASRLGRSSSCKWKETKGLWLGCQARRQTGTPVAMPVGGCQRDVRSPLTRVGPPRSWARPTIGGDAPPLSRKEEPE